jgi:hypothetical protein
MRFGRLLVLNALLMAASIGSAFACSCARNPTAEGLLQDSAAVFTAVAQGSRPVAPGVSITTFRVTEGFKGPAAGTTVRVGHRSGSSASCGVQFESGKAHTLAVGSGQSGFSASLCSTWMFLPQVGLGADLIEKMRALRSR